VLDPELLLVLSFLMYLLHNFFRNNCKHYYTTDVAS